MARRRLLNDVQWAALLSPPADEREIVRHYTLSAEDLAAVSTKRGNHNRIGFALTLCYLRFPGRALGCPRVGVETVDESAVHRTLGAGAGLMHDHLRARPPTVAGCAGVRARRSTSEPAAPPRAACAPSG